MGPQYHDTVYGQRFYPNHINNLEMEVSTADDKTYVCYHENSLALELEAGKISDMIATTDIKGAFLWLNESLSDAKKNGFHFVDEGESKLYDALSTGENFESIMFKDGDRNHNEFFSICVRSFL